MVAHLQSVVADSANANRIDELEAKRKELFELIKRCSFSEGESKLLASGRESSFYFNMKRSMAQPRGLALIAELMLERLPQDECDIIGGLEMGAIPILNAVALESHHQNRDLPLFWIRKKAKEHGSKAKLEGFDVEELRGKRAVMVDDVTTTGGSVLKAIVEGRNNGLEIDRVLTIVDREEGAEENLQEAGVKLEWLFRASEFRS